MKSSDILFIVLILCIIVLSVTHFGFFGIILLAVVYGLWDSRDVSGSAKDR